MPRRIARFPLANINLAPIQDPATRAAFEELLGFLQALLTQIGGTDEESIADGAVGTPQLADGAVGAPQLADGVVTNPKLGADAVDDTKLADDAVGNEHLQDDAVGTTEIQDGAVTAAKLPADVIDDTKLADNAVGNEHLQDNAVDTLELADSAVETVKIADDAVTPPKLDVNAGGDEDSTAPQLTTSWAAYASVTVTTEGEALFIIATAVFEPVAAVSRSCLMRISRDSTVIKTQQDFQIITTLGGTGNEAAAQCITDQPAAGTYTYKLEAQTPSSTDRPLINGPSVVVGFLK